MTIKILNITVEISDQYGTSENILVGAFDNSEKLDAAMKHQEKKHKNKRTAFKITEVILNIPLEG